MASVIAFPVLVATVRLHLDKGKRWNALEHLLLFAVCERAMSAPELAELAKLPRRLVIEVMIRLMRVGWVELTGTKEHSGFNATIAGKRVVRYESLPAITRPLSRRGSFAIDQVSGTVFRARELALYTKARLEKIQSTTDVVVLPREVESPRPQVDEVISTLLDDDEHCRGLEPSGGKLIERFAVVRISGKAITGLPARAPGALAARIRNAAALATATSPSESAASSAEPLSDETGPLEIAFRHDDLVLGGPAHKLTFETLLRKAKYRVVIHSTFINADKFALILPLVRDAAKRGVRIDVLWGQSKDPEGGSKAAIEAEKCRALLDEEYLRERVRLHSFTTNSHAKVVLCDNGRGQFVAVLGSCNWISSSFESFEVSAFLTDPLAVGDIAGKLASMTVSGAGHWTALTRELGALGATLRRAPRPGGPKVRAKFVLGGEHDRYVRQARDEAKARIVIASHRFSDNAETMVLIPARSAMEAHGVDVTLLFGRTSGAEKGKLAKSLVDAASGHGIKLHQIYHPRFHAKFLAWDDDSIVITSQNWLSADPPESAPFAEIGIYLAGKGLAKELISLTEVALKVAR